jgi:hypothetical protein
VIYVAGFAIAAIDAAATSRLWHAIRLALDNTPVDGRQV